MLTLTNNAKQLSRKQNKMTKTPDKNINAK